MPIRACLPWTAITILLAIVSPVHASGVTNRIGGNIVDRATQKPLDGVKVVFHKVGDPSTVFDTVVAAGAGRYETDKMDRQNTWFTVEYTKDSYVSDARPRVGNDVFTKELDTVALVAMTVAAETEAYAVSALQATIRFVTASQDVKQGQTIVDTLAKRGPDRFRNALASNPDIRNALKTVGLVVPQ